MYSSKPLFSYADGYFLILPPKFAEKRIEKGWALHREEDYTICFKPGTPEDIKQRFIKEYVEYENDLKKRHVL